MQNMRLLMLGFYTLCPFPGFGCDRVMRAFYIRSATRA